MSAAPLSARVLREVDGDTFEARIRIWLDQDLVRLVRIAGIDAPELKGHCPGEREAAAAARAFLAGLLGEEVELLTVQSDKYARRVVAAVRLPDGKDLGRALLAAGHALPTKRGRIVRCEAAP